jgi:iron complex transport system substrate-binding protein
MHSILRLIAPAGLLAGGLAAALAAGAPAAQASGFPVTVTSCDRKVTFDKAPQHAVSQDVNMTEMMLALDLKDHMAGYSGISGWYKMEGALKEGLSGLPEISPRDPTKEALLAADADFLFAGWNYGLKVGGAVTPQTLEPFGIKVYELTESCIHIMGKSKVTMEDMYADILALGQIFGVAERAEALVAGYRATVAATLENLPKDGARPRVFVYDSGEDKPFTAGRYAMPTALIEAAGGSNIMDDIDKSWTTVAWEPVIERNPDMVVIVDYGDVTAEQKMDFMRNNPALKDIAAVKANRFVVLPYAQATPGPRNVAAVKVLAEAFHREVPGSGARP